MYARVLQNSPPACGTHGTQTESFKRICKKLGDTFTCEAYYTDVRVWVPQLEFGVDPAHSGAGVGGGS